MRHLNVLRPLPLPHAMASLLSSLCLFLVFLSLANAARQTYIVHMNKNHKPLHHTNHADWYADHLQSLFISPTDAILYTYDAVLSGFAATLNLFEAEALRGSDSVLGIYEDTVYHLHTTRTPDFLGLNAPMGDGKLPCIDQATEDIIIGILDTGIWPESSSLDDAGMPEVPSRWRGSCVEGTDFSPASCNRKLIGAKAFSKGMAEVGLPEETSSRDHDGHGTHAASIAAGSPVANASMFGYAAGTARGMAPRARIAIYKVCWELGCFGSDILAGLEAAIADGVDILSLSFGAVSAPYKSDPISIGSFAAAKHGIFVACSAGNDGPNRGSVGNVAPWVITVGAGTLDRRFPAYISLGSGAKYTGVSLYSGEGMGTEMLPIVYNVSNGEKAKSSNLCSPGTLDINAVRGKVVVCDSDLRTSRVEKSLAVKKAGGAAMILVDSSVEELDLIADSHLLPTVAVGRAVGGLVKEYLRADRHPTAVISFGGTVLDVKPSPVVGAFSSRGPNAVAPEILKPDLIGPGLNILAAWTQSAGPTGLMEDKRRVKFNIKSGTSMSCPHIAGVAALIKAAHPSWSPSAIKSALMTTAYNLDNTKSPFQDAAGGDSTPFAHGAGHVDPQKALSPGLIYDISAEDYIDYLCYYYSPKDIEDIVLRPNITCDHGLVDPGNLNYPSFSVQFSDSRKVVTCTRELTNVGSALSVYSVVVGGPANVAVKVRPGRLLFEEAGQKLKYNVTFEYNKAGKWKDAFGWITWSNQQQQVRSPVTYVWQSEDSVGIM